MHLHFDFSARQILWTLTFAAQLVLLVVLLGRDRARRYPWFTAGVALLTLRLMAEVLLSGRLPTIPLQEILLPLGDLAVIVSLLVVVEMARRAFAGAGRLAWIIGSLALAVVAVGVLVLWGPWPAWKDLGVDTLLGRLRLMQLTALKGNMLANLLTVELGVLVALFGRIFKAGWRSHTQMIVIGLSTAAISWLGMQGGWQIITKTAHPQSRAEYERIIALAGKLLNASSAVYLAVLVWWIVWLWLDEPGTGGTATEPAESLLTEEPPQIAG